MTQEIEIPEGYEAKIENNKVIFVPKESEDERIRKEIVGFIEQVLKNKNVLLLVADRIGDDIPNMIPGWLAYLEKQKEPKLLNNEEYQTVPVEILNRLYASERELQEIKRKEQKPAEWSEEDENTLEYSDPLKRFVDMVHSVDKDEFTEFEYSIINFVLACCDKSIAMTPKGIHCYAKTILNIVKKEFTPKNCGWTDEEETVLHNACEFIRHRLNDSICRNGSIGGMDYNVLYEKLKSLHPQPHWKPSKEQMDILDKVYHYLWADRNATADMQDGLGDFIDELKEL